MPGRYAPAPAEEQGALEVPRPMEADSRQQAESMAVELNYQHPVLGHTWAAVSNSVGDWSARPVIIL